MEKTEQTKKRRPWRAAALVVLALGLLFLWIFVWFVGGAIAGLINEIIKLGGKWCFKEVSAA